MAASLAAQVPVKSLADCCTDVIMYAFHLSRTQEDPGDAQTLSNRLRALLQDMQTKASAAGYPADDVSQAQYALAALLDEIVLTSNWALKSQWLGHPLQLQMFNSFNAGEEFYSRLDALRKAASADRKKADVIEIYYLCLCLGFKGKFGGVQHMQTLKQWKDALSRAITFVKQERGKGRTQGPVPSPGKSGSSPKREKADGLSPRWRPADQLAATKREVPIRMWIVVCLALLVLSYGVLAGYLRTTTNGVRDRLAPASAAAGDTSDDKPADQRSDGEGE